MADTVLTASAERHHEAFEELLSEVEEYNPGVDRDLLERSYRFACEAHEGQQRRSGEDFVPGDVLAIAATIPLVLLLTTFISQSRLGRAMRATAQDPEAARLMGINVDTSAPSTTIPSNAHPL